MTDRAGPRYRMRRVFGLTLLGAFLLQVAWIVAVPTFRGADEFDHVYKFDAVSAGQLRGTTEATNGRGQLLAVRPGVVDAAGPMCASYEYSQRDNCYQVGPGPDGRVTIASAAASYNPSYYLLAGTLARPFDGHAFDIALRVVTAGAAALLLAAAAATVAERARTSWPMLGLAVCITPTLVSSAAVAAPNGVGYAAAALWWTSALAVTYGERPPWRRLVAASVVLVCTHTLNVMWLPLMVLAILPLRPFSWWRERLREPQAVAAVASVTVSGALCVAWIKMAGTNRLNEPISGIGPFPWDRMLGNEIVWALQTVAVGPLRNQPQHMAIYAMWSVALLAFLVLGARAARRTELRSMGIVLFLWLAVPLALTLVSYPTEGFAWQGRYALPLVMGLPLLAAAALDRGRRPGSRSASVLAALTAIAHVWAVVGVTREEAGLGTSLALADAVSVTLAATLTGATAAAGLVVVILATRGESRRKTMSTAALSSS